jgi:peptidoglycan-associated lipoprotein
MLSRSRSLLAFSAMCLITVFFVTGCKTTEPKAERRLPLSYDMSTDSAPADGVAGTSAEYLPEEWENNSRAPGGMEIGSGQVVPSDLDIYDPATDSLEQTANLDNVEDGEFVSELMMVHFVYDSSEIASDWKSTLDDHASWINDHPNAMVQIEGHCDERGTEEYNVSLGQRRADTVRNYLVSKGTDPNRLSTISYGKMRPLSFDANDESNALNRRAMFLVYEVAADNTVAMVN